MGNKVYTRQMGNNFQAFRGDGWLLAECSKCDGIFNGFHDGTVEGKAAFQMLVDQYNDRTSNLCTTPQQ